MNLRLALSRIAAGVLFFILVCVIATIGYLIAGWPLNDAIYMVIITIFGVGYGEVRPVDTPVLRSLTIIVIIAGYAAAIYAVGGVVQLVTEGEINRALGERRMTKGIQRLENHTIVCGYGRLGQGLAEDLHKGKHEVVVIDQNIERLREAESLGLFVVHGNAMEEEVLLKAGIEKAQSMAAVMRDDAANVFITLTARELNHAVEIIARAENPHTEKKLLRSGASKVVLPAAIGAQKMAHLITRPSAEKVLEHSQIHGRLNDELMQIGLQLGDLTVPPNSSLIGKPLSEIEVRAWQSVLVVAVRRADGHVVVNPAQDLKLEAGDTVVVLGHKEDMPQLSERYAVRREITYRGVRTEI